MKNEIYRDDPVLGEGNVHLSEIKVYSKYIRYNKLDMLCNESIFLDGIPGEVNVFIDLYPFLTSLCSFNKIEDPFGYTSALLNLPIHYRNYFNRLGIKSNIFLIYTSNYSANNYKYLSDYNSKYNRRLINNPIVKNDIDRTIGSIANTIRYFPGVYLKIGTVESTVIAYDLIDKFVKNGFYKPNIFITSSDYSYQLPAIMKNVYVFYKHNIIPEKSMFRFNTDEDKDGSFVIYHDNALFTYILKTKNKDIKNIDDYRYLDQTWVSPFMILNGLVERNIKPLVNYPTVFKILNNIKNNYQSITPDNIYDSLIKISKNTKIPREEIFNRYYGLDLDYQLKLYRTLPESLEKDFLINLDNWEKLHSIINRHFSGRYFVDIGKL